MCCDFVGILLLSYAMNGYEIWDKYGYASHRVIDRYFDDLFGSGLWRRRGFYLFILYKFASCWDLFYVVSELRGGR